MAFPRGLYLACIFASGIGLWIVPDRAFAEKPEQLCHLATSDSDSLFAHECIVIFANEPPEWTDSPHTIQETKSLPRAIVAFSGKRQYLRIMEWLKDAKEYVIPNRGNDEVVAAEFVIEIRDAAGDIKKTYVSNGCIFEDESGRLFHVSPEMQVFLAGLTGRGTVDVNCRDLEAR